MNKHHLISLIKHIFKQGPTCRILLYHRVADVKNDPHLLSVSVHNFRDQIAWLQKNYHIVPLSKLVDQIKYHTLNSKSICITFDDGYADNFYNALPILKQLKVPVTIFITSGMIGKKTPFYWDINTYMKDRGRALSRLELRKLAKEPLIEIGSHSITHPSLSTLSVIEQKKEITKSKMDLENIIKKRIISFSYPFGTKKDYNKETVFFVKKAGYKYACANFPDNILKPSNFYTLPRILVRDLPIENFIKKIGKLL